MKTETNHGTLKYISELILAILYWLKCHDIGYNVLLRRKGKNAIFNKWEEILKEEETHAWLQFAKLPLKILIN